jgi:hypothetical protein
MADLTNTGLNAIYGNIESPMASADLALRQTLGSIPEGGEVTTAQLLKLQYQIARYTVTASVFSAILKEVSDSLKGTANKIG